MELDAKLLNASSAAYAAIVQRPVNSLIRPVGESAPRKLKVAGQSYRFLDSITSPLLVLALVLLTTACLSHEYFYVAFILAFMREHVVQLERIVTTHDLQRSQLTTDIHFIKFVVNIVQSVGDILLFWTLILVSQYQAMSYYGVATYLVVLWGLLALEAILLWIRIDDFFPPSYSASVPAYARISGFGKALGSSAKGVIRRKLVWVGLSLACLGAGDPSGMVGVLTTIVLGVALILAYQNVSGKLHVRNEWQSERRQKMELEPVEQEQLSDAEGREGDDDDAVKKPEFSTVYTIGCFDMFHAGHRNLLRRMRRMGKRVVVGLHDDHSIYQLKDRYPICNTIKRLRDVKRYADQVYVISSTDPSAYLDGIIDRKDASSSVYVRGNDMPNFPGRHIADALLSIRLIPYTEGVSSTMLRAQLTTRRRMSVDDSDDSEDSDAPFWVYYEHRWEQSNLRSGVSWQTYGEDYVRFFTATDSPTIQ